MRGRVIAVDDFAEADNAGEPLRAALIESPDFHFLAREVIIDKIDFQPRIGGIARVGIAADEFTHRIERLLRDFLVARDVGDLLVIIERDQIIGIGRVAVAGVDRQEARRRFGRLDIIARHIVRKCTHQLRTARPRRIGVLAFNFVKQGRRKFILVAVKPVFRRRIQRVNIASDIGGVGFLAVGRATADGGEDRERGDDGNRTVKSNTHVCCLSGMEPVCQLRY